jgi:small subunit ribosomal protein S14
MTISSYKKMFTQLRHKKTIMAKYLKFNKPIDRKFGKSTKLCQRCGNMRGFIQKYGLKLCRKCFREIAEDIGFKKYS